ncbi:uncharacterized protein LOC134211637 [Armigeres subalbatus]|uniref:uncharacterized protein LOC134211637 n=1 Tax=Armigeres subalbatus TaxID=124917 RepID=UPI002ED57E86
MTIAGVCDLVKLFSLLLVVLPFCENGGAVRAKAIGNVTSEEIDNEIIIIVSSSTQLSSVGTTEETTVRTTTDGSVPTFDRDHVTLRVPDELFASSANLTLKLRDLIGDLLVRSVTRLAKMMRFFQPLFGGHLTIEIPKELDKT